VSSNYNTNKKKKAPIAFRSNGYMIPLLIVTAIIPLIMLGKMTPSHVKDYPMFSPTPKTLDIFLYYKQLFLELTGAVSLVILVITFLKHKDNLRRNKAFYFLSAYSILAILSIFTSKNKTACLTGIQEQFESIFALLAYCLICYYSYQFVRSESQLRYLLKGIVISICMMVLIGILQITGHDPITSDKGINFICMFLKQSMSARPNFGSQVFLTLFNPDYVGVYCVLLLPILIILFLHTRNRMQQVFYVLLTVGLSVCLYYSDSKAGMLTMGICLLFLLILYRKVLWNYKKFAIPSFCIIVCVGIVCFYHFNISQRIHSVFFNTATPNNLEQIETKDDCVTIRYQGLELNIAMIIEGDNACSFRFTDIDGNNIPFELNQETSTFTLKDDRYPQFPIVPVSINDRISFYITVDGNNLCFTNQYTDDHHYYFINPFGNYVLLPSPTKLALPESFDHFASNRGFIWSSSIPLLKDHILLGTGADCFAFEYPNLDYVSFIKYNFYGQVMTKPHSLYLQIGIQTGILSLAAFVIFYLIYWITSIKIYLRCPLDTLSKQMGAAVLVSTTGYMITGITNDSSITVAPIFWVLTGIGMALNHMNKHFTIS